MSDAPQGDTIVIKAPAGTKTRWVRQSQARGMTLSDWVRAQVDRPANKTALEPCRRCESTVITYDAGDWPCAQCGLL